MKMTASPREYELLTTALRVWAGSEELLGKMTHAERQAGGVTPERCREARENSARAYDLLGKLNA